MQFLSFISHNSNVPSYLFLVASGQCRSRTFPSTQKVLLNNASLGSLKS